MGDEHRQEEVEHSAWGAVIITTVTGVWPVIPLIVGSRFRTYGRYVKVFNFHYPSQRFSLY